MQNVTLAVLAGGAGTRMGKPKSLLTIGGRPILTVLLEQYRWAGPTLLVTAPGRTRPPGATEFEREVVDPVADGGPLVGVITAMAHLRTELLIVTTVDMPGVGPGQFQWLVETLGPSDLGVMGSRLSGESRQVEPFPSIYRAEAGEALRAHLAAGNRSMHSLLRDPRFVSAATPGDWPSSVWANLNYPADVEAFRTSPPR